MSTIQVTLHKKGSHQFRKKPTGKRPKIALSSDSDSDNEGNMTQVPQHVEEEKLRRNPPHICIYYINDTKVFRMSIQIYCTRALQTK